MNNCQLTSFLRNHMLGWQYAWKAHDDYLLVRLGMQSGLFSAFEMSAQAVEKLLKSYLFFVVEEYNGDSKALNKDIRERAKKDGRNTLPTHYLRAILLMAKDNGLQLHDVVLKWVDAIDAFYFCRYPEDRKVKTLDCNALEMVDNTIFQVWDGFKDLNQDYYYTCGIMISVYEYYHNKQFFPNNRLFAEQNYHIFSGKNFPYEERRQELLSEIFARLN